MESREIELTRELAQQLRVDCIRSSTQAGSGHPTSGMSAADLMATLLFRHLRYDWEHPRSDSNDHLLFSKGHASPLLYAMFKAAGCITDEELLTYRKFGSRLQGHPTPAIPWVDVATGSLGQGLPIGVGIALAGKRLEHADYRVWVLCGDSELAEGSMWEAIDKASFYGLANLVAILDVNRLGQRGPTEYEWDVDVYRTRVEAFGCRAFVIDGHDLNAIDDAYEQATKETTRPSVIIAKTVKGKGFHEIEDDETWHGKALPIEMAERAIAELGGARDLRVPGRPRAPFVEKRREASDFEAVNLPTFEKGKSVATRQAFGKALEAMGAIGDVVVLDGEVSNSTHTGDFAKAYPDRFFQMYIAEQQLVAAAVGMSVRGYRPFLATFSAFLSRAYDFLRMAAVSQANLRVCGSHAGVEIGQDGPSQMGLEDIAAMRAVHGSTVLYPSDATSTAALVRAMAEQGGVVYLRTTRGKYPVLYAQDEPFPIGGAKLLRASDDDDIALIGAGVTVHQCLAAAEELADDGISARVIDLYSVKPVDTALLRQAVQVTGGRLVVAEDHYPEGGIGSAVLEALALEERPPRMAHCAVRKLPSSGTPEELMDDAGISARHIANAAREMVFGEWPRAMSHRAEPEVAHHTGDAP